MVTAQVTTQGEQLDSSIPQWLNFNFQKKKKIVLPSITLQETIAKSPRRPKKAKTLHHLSRSDSGDIVARIVTLAQGT